MLNGPYSALSTISGCGLSPESDLSMRELCFTPVGNGYSKKSLQGCDASELVEKDGFLFQKGGPPMNQDRACKDGWTFAMPYEVGFVLNFTVIDNYPRGCGPLDGDWRFKFGRPNCQKYCGNDIARPNKMYIGSPGYDGSPPCGPNTYAPEGETSANIVAKFADDHDLWSKTFFNAWEKMQLNGYITKDLDESPSNGNLLAPFMS